MRFGQPTLQPCLRCRVRALFCPLLQTRAISSVVERLLHTQEVAGSNPASRTIFKRAVAAATSRRFEPCIAVRFLATLSYCLALSVRRFRHHRSKLLEARIVPERIEHWIELEQRRSERYV